jgi:uncharacterized protein (TIGR02996 family)
MSTWYHGATFVPERRVDELDVLLQGVVEEPLSEPLWSVVADWLEEHDEPRRAELLRLHRKLLATSARPYDPRGRAALQAAVVRLLADGVRPCVPRRAVALPGGLEMAFHFVPPGTFLMGSPEGEAGRSEDETPHAVTLTAGFWLGVVPVTQAQWRAVMGTDPSHFKGDGLPVEQVGWDDCREFCDRLGREAGWRFRLPTEAEWERACRAGTTTAFFWGGGEQGAGPFCWCSEPGKPGSAGGTRPAGTLLPNAWGLFDMHGNVWEWCEDRYGPLPWWEETDPRGPAEGDIRVLRGGCWVLPGDCRSARRTHRVAAGHRASFIGFRVCLCPG